MQVQWDVEQVFTLTRDDMSKTEAIKLVQETMDFIANLKVKFQVHRNLENVETIWIMI